MHNRRGFILFRVHILSVRVKSREVCRKLFERTDYLLFLCIGEEFRQILTDKVFIKHSFKPCVRRESLGYFLSHVLFKFFHSLGFFIASVALAINLRILFYFLIEHVFRIMPYIFKHVVNKFSVVAVNIFLYPFVVLGSFLVLVQNALGVKILLCFSYGSQRKSECFVQRIAVDKLFFHM